MKKINVGIIGFGLSGKYFHYQLLRYHPGFKVTMISTSKDAEVKALDSSIYVTNDPFELIKSSKLDLIINTAPNVYHYPLSKAALENNKHVVVEKPFVTNSKEGLDLIQTAQNTKKNLTVYHNRRWDADFLTIKKLIANNQLGKIKIFESHFDRWNPIIKAERWREQEHAGSGILFDLGSHLIDQALQLFGKPESITADIGSQKEGSLVDDYFHLLLNYKDQKRVILHSSCFANTTPRFQIFGDVASFIKYGLDPQEQQLKNNQSYLEADFGVDKIEHYGKLLGPKDQRIDLVPSELGCYKNFYEILHQKITSDVGDVPVTAHDALQVIKLIELAIESSKLGQTIRLPDTF